MSNVRQLRAWTCSCCGCRFGYTPQASIHRDGFDVGPEVVLCNDCGLHELPSCETIWNRIATRKAAGEHFDEAP
jgi:hypothetical protein